MFFLFLCSSKNKKIIQYLIENYPLNINAVSSTTKRNIMDYDLLLNLGLTEYLLSKGAKVDVTSDIFMDALLEALSRKE